jgi:hypothetical protein
MAHTCGIAARVSAKGEWAAAAKAMITLTTTIIRESRGSGNIVETPLDTPFKIIVSLKRIIARHSDSRYDNYHQCSTLNAKKSDG